MEEEQDRLGFIYKITNRVNGKIYIGKSTYKSLRLLIARYYREIKQKNKVRYITRAMLKYGLDNFEFEIILGAVPEKQLSLEEIKYIAAYQANNEAIGYNLTIGGEGVSGLKWRKESRDKQSLATIGRYKGENNPFWGKKHTKETIDAVIASNRRRRGEKRNPLSEENRKNRSERMKGNIPWNKGKEYLQIKGKNNPNYREIDIDKFKLMIREGKKYKEICAFFNIGQCCFYSKLKEFNMREEYNGTLPS